MNIMIKKNKPVLNSLWPEIALIVALFLIWIFLYKVPLTTDVTYQLWVAQRLLSGSKFYVDIIESNPPLWFWMAIPVEYVAQKININSGYVLVTFFVMYAMIGLFLISIMKKNDSPNNRVIFLLSITAIMLLISLYDVGQREHLVLISVLPYIVLLAKRVDMEEVPLSIAMAVGFFASFGFALKHYFAIVPIFVELFLIFKLKNRWKIFRPEIITLIFMAFVYVISIFLFSSEYFYNIVPVLNVMYSSYGLPFYYNIFNINIYYWFFCILTIFVYKDFFKPSLALVSFVAGVGFVCCYFLQNKAWTYHALPATGVFCFSIVASLTAKNTISLKIPQRFIFSFVFLYPFIISILLNGLYKGPSSETIKIVMRKAPQGSYVFALTLDPSIIWPEVINKGYRWPSRNFSFWMLTSKDMNIYEKHELPANREKILDDTLNQVAVDLSCNPPSVILVDGFRGGKKMLNFMKNSERFNRMFSHYKLYETVEEKIDFYFKSEAFEPEKSSNCIKF